jgi:hypothetical protein
MKDSVVRGRLLQLLFERRADAPLPFGAAVGAIPPPAGIDERAWLHALAELSSHQLVNWTPETNAAGAMSGFAEITDAGADAYEGRVKPPIDLRFC